MVTKLTEIPYIISLWLIAFVIVYLTILCFLSNVTYADQHHTLYNQLITPGNNYNTIATALGVVKISLALFFIAVRVFEIEAFLMFIVF